MTDLAPPPTSAEDWRTKRNVIILVAAQAFLGAQMPMIFTIAGLAGQSLASNPCFATLPISMIVLGSMCAATPVSAFMQRFGRRAGFALGTTGGALGGAIGALGLYTASFPLFLLGSLLTGIYMSAQGFYRFAAADTASDAYRPKAISYVMAGGLASAIIGPQLVKLTADAFVVPFLGTYAAVIAINLVGALLLRLQGIDGQGFWIDEHASVLMAGDGPHPAIARIRSDVHPPFYFSLLHFYKIFYSFMHITIYMQKTVYQKMCKVIVKIYFVLPRI